MSRVNKALVTQMLGLIFCCNVQMKIIEEKTSIKSSIEKEIFSTAVKMQNKFKHMKLLFSIFIQRPLNQNLILARYTIKIELYSEIKPIYFV